MEVKVKEYLFILCFTTGTAHRIEMPKPIFGSDIEKFITDQGFNVKQCKYMITAHKSLMKRETTLVN